MAPHLQVRMDLCCPCAQKERQDNLLFSLIRQTGGSFHGTLGVEVTAE